MARVNIEIPDFLLSDNLWTLPEKLKNVSLCLLESNPLVNCRMKTEWPYLIHEIKRVGRNVIFCIDCPRGREYRLPEQYAKAVSDHDIHTVNSYKILNAVIKRERDDASGISDLATLRERLEFDTAQRATCVDVACNRSYTLVDKFDLINSSIRAEPLGIVV